ncbi:PKD domain-containing protein [Lutibacter holmesii]|uniref:PKD domain-containing protein n=1 Tax=Lutibacter holmesii TaxID=1137985 RepID=A0ABW3WRI1_9FLAO
MLLGLMSCIDNGYEEFVPPTGNVNNIQPNTLFTTTTSADDTMSFVFRSYSTDADSYLWDFGDGNTSTEANPDYTYAEGGLYKVKLTTISSDNLMASDSSEVAPIYVEFETTQVDTEVTFENLVSGASSLVWDFGDGETLEWDIEDTVEDANFSPTHTYKTADTFTATLTATTFLGVAVSYSQSIEGLILSTIPDFSFTSNGFTVDFIDESVLAVSYSWDFGDGNTSTEVNPTHTFAGEGTYDVTLTTTNEAGVSKSITKPVPVGAPDPSFSVVVQNGTADDWTKNTGDNADAWDMTPNSTIEDNDGNTIDSPYRAIWYNKELNNYIDATYGTNEQPGSSSDGTYIDGVKTRAVKLSNSSRRLYQVVAVEPGIEYTFTMDSRSEAEGINTEVFILNNEITTEAGLDANKGDDASVDAYYNITNDYNKDKSSATENTFTTTTFRFKPTSNIAVIYVRALNAVNSSNEVFIDNIDIITPQGGGGVDATFKAIVVNGDTEDGADAWNMSKYGNSDLDAWLLANTGDKNQQPGSTSDGNWADGAKTKGLKIYGPGRRVYQPVTVEVGVEYTFTMESRSEAEGVPTEVYILNTEITSEDNILDYADAFVEITNDYNKDKSSATENNFTTTTFTFIPTTTTAVIYFRAPNAVDSSHDVFYDNIDIITPGF